MSDPFRIMRRGNGALWLQVEPQRHVNNLLPPYFECGFNELICDFKVKITREKSTSIEPTVR